MARYQAQLQKNLLYLAAIADAQPPTTPSIRPQVVPLPQPSMQQGAPFMHQNPAFSPRPLMQFNPQQLHDQQQQQQHRLMNFPPHMGMRPGVMNGLQAMHHSQTSYGAGCEIPLGSAMAELPRGSVSASRPMDGQASKQDTGRADPSNDGQRGAVEHGTGEVVEPAAYMKRQEDCKT
ncbi:GRF1-interacting factor 3 [Platanthera zijinensis]|uniref:GRF1-interacting factor 3 n=1 Tax=Platanthera zijinensis TaxID=2320716 RepID=A0AAP0BX16_9ASPA